MAVRYSPPPPDAPLVSPRRVPRAVAKSYIGYPNLALNLLMHRGAGGTVRDYSGNGNHGTIYGAKWSNRHLFSWALDFDGSDDWVNVGDSPSLQISDQITVIAWVTVPDTTVDVWTRIITKKASWYASDGYSFCYRPSTDEYGFLGSGNTFSTVTANIADGKPHQAAAKADGGTVYLFTDGEFVGSGDVDPVTGASGVDLYVSSDPDRQHPWKGMIGDVYIVDGLPSDSEIKAFYENTKSLYIG